MNNYVLSKFVDALIKERYNVSTKRCHRRRLPLKSSFQENDCQVLSGRGDHFFAFIPIQKPYINTVKDKVITATTSRIVMVSPSFTNTSL